METKLHFPRNTKQLAREALCKDECFIDVKYGGISKKSRYYFPVVSPEYKCDGFAVAFVSQKGNVRVKYGSEIYWSLLPKK